jgi:heme oxygenase
MVLTRLREETRAQHGRVEELLALLSPAMTVTGYCRVLQVMYAAWLPLEAALGQHCPAQYAELWRGRQRAHRIQTDLAALGCTPDANLPGSYPSATLPDLSTGAAWLGALYVTEGSTLGGQQISRHLEQKFGWLEGRGHTFFLAYREQTGERWRAVQQALEAPGLDGNQVIRGAHQTFSYLELCFAAGI